MPRSGRLGLHDVFLLLRLLEEIPQLLRALAAVSARVDVHQVGRVQRLHRFRVDRHYEAADCEGQQAHHYQQQRGILDGLLVGSSVLHDCVYEQHGQRGDSHLHQNRKDLHRQ